MVTAKELSFEEQRQLQLEILNEVDDCCKKYNIRYSLAFGTLLGAIRHKGYIPWDDDLDIMMPYEDMIRLRDNLASRNIFFHDVDTDTTYGNPFGNICSNRTYRVIGRSKDRGLGIDVYPIVKLPADEYLEEIFFLKAQKLQKRRSQWLKTRLFMLKHFSCTPVLGYKNVMRAYRDHLVSYNMSDSKRYYIIASPLSSRNAMTYDSDLFEKIIEVEFEGNFYKAIADYDYFLRKTYGDYMELPPEEKRHPIHCQHYYWK